VSGVADVNDRSNVAGAGINIAQRVMDLGDAGHILLSKRAAEDLSQYQPMGALSSRDRRSRSETWSCASPLLTFTPTPLVIRIVIQTPRPEKMDGWSRSAAHRGE
jgi:class 3 adenylate cyclase